MHIKHFLSMHFFDGIKTIHLIKRTEYIDLQPYRKCFSKHQTIQPDIALKWHIFNAVVQLLSHSLINAWDTVSLKNDRNSAANILNFSPKIFK